MQKEESVFEKTYRFYLAQIADISLESVAPRLGAKKEGSRITVPFFNVEYTISDAGIADASGNRPSHDICVVLSRYVLMCPENPPADRDWVTFRNFKDAGPLIGYFTNDVERAAADRFSGKLGDLKRASDILAAYPPAIEVNVDFAAQFDALPKVPVIVLFNDADAEFPANASVLFESRAETYLDAECLAMLGWQMVRHLKKANP